MTKEQEAQQARSDILTKEERETVEKIRVEHRTFQQHIMTKMDMITDLLRIIDNLSKRGVKKYSEEELRLLWQKKFPHQSCETNESLDGVIWLARFLGALEEK